MNRFKKQYSLLCCFFLFLGCASKGDFEPYSFFVAGHTYGSPNNYEGGLYPPFVNQFAAISADTLISKGFFTGDLVKESTIENWNLVEEDLEGLKNVDIHFVAGNHDMQNRELYESLYGKTYYAIDYKNDLFIVLDGNLDGWNISGEQLSFLKNELNQITDSVNNVFLFVHQVLFVESTQITPNSLAGKSAHLNFETTVLPLLTALDKPVFLFTGDVGAFGGGTFVFHEQRDNVTFIASGMGGGNGDNYLIVNVFENKEVNISIMPLNNREWQSIEHY